MNLQLRWGSSSSRAFVGFNLKHSVQAKQIGPLPSIASYQYPRHAGANSSNVPAASSIVGFEGASAARGGSSAHHLIGYSHAAPAFHGCLTDCKPADFRSAFLMKRHEEAHRGDGALYLGLEQVQNQGRIDVIGRRTSIIPDVGAAFRRVPEMARRSVCPLRFQQNGSRIRALPSSTASVNTTPGAVTHRITAVREDEREFRESHSDHNRIRSSTSINPDGGTAFRRIPEMAARSICPATFLTA